MIIHKQMQLGVRIRCIVPRLDPTIEPRKAEGHSKHRNNTAMLSNKPLEILTKRKEKTRKENAQIAIKEQ